MSNEPRTYQFVCEGCGKSVWGYGLPASEPTPRRCGACLINADADELPGNYPLAEESLP